MRIAFLVLASALIATPSSALELGPWIKYLDTKHINDVGIHLNNKVSDDCWPAADIQTKQFELELRKARVPVTENVFDSQPFSPITISTVGFAVIRKDGVKVGCTGHLLIEVETYLAGKNNTDVVTKRFKLTEQLFFNSQNLNEQFGDLIEQTATSFALQYIKDHP